MLKQLKLLQTASALALLLALPVHAQETTAEDAAPADAATAPADATAPAATDAPAADAAATDAPAADAAATDAPAADAAATDAPAADAAPAAPATPLTRDTVVASVDGHDITLGQVLVAVSQLPAQYQQLPPDVLFPGVVDQIIQQQLLADTVTTEPSTLQLQLDSQRRSILANAAIGEFVRTAVTEDAIKAAYDAQYANAEPVTEWNASHILVATEDEAKAVEDRLAKGEDFAAVAKEVSTDTGSGAQGGELGWFGPGTMVPEFETGVKDLQPGQVSAPVQSQFGWHVIKLNETRPKAVPALEDVRGDLTNQLQSQAIQDHLAQLEAGAQVTRPAEGQFDPAAALDPSLLQE